MTNYFNASSFLVGMSNTFGVQKKIVLSKFCSPTWNLFSVMSLYFLFFFFSFLINLFPSLHQVLSLYFLLIGDLTRKYFPKGLTYVKFEYINNECQVSENLLMHRGHLHLGIFPTLFSQHTHNLTNSTISPSPQLIGFVIFSKDGAWIIQWELLERHKYEKILIPGYKENASYHFSRAL